MLSLGVFIILSFISARSFADGALAIDGNQGSKYGFSEPISFG